MSDAAIDLARQKRLPFRVNRGQAIDFSITVKNADGTDYDFTGHSAELLVYNSFSKTDSPEFSVTVTLSTGSMRFTHDAITSKREEFVCRLWVTNASGYRQPWTNGPFLVLNREWDQNDGDDTLTISPDGDNLTLTITPLGGSSSGGASTAEDVSYTPSGSIVADNVQDAIEELDADIQAIEGESITVSNGLTRTGDNITLGGTLTANTTFTGAKRITFSPGTGQGSVAGLNVGSVAGNPSTAGLANGDMWYNSSTHKLMARVNTTSVSIKTSDDVSLTTAGSGLTAVDGTVSFGGTTTGDVTLEPATLNTGNVQIGTFNSKAYNNVFVSSERVHFYVNPHATSSSDDVHFVVYGGTALTELLALDKAAPMAIKSTSDRLFFGDADGSLNHYTLITPSTHTWYTRMRAGASDFADYTHSNDGFTFDVNGTDLLVITSSGAALSGTPTAPTAAAGTDTTQLATTAFVKAAVAGTQDLSIMAPAMWPRTTNGCAALAKTEMATSIVNIQSLDFDQTTQEFAQFQIVLPRNWNNGTVTARFYWTAASGSGTVQWGISGGAYSNDDALTVALGTAQTVDDTLIAANDLHVTDYTSAITLAGSPADADFLVFQISRNPGSDTLTADAKLLGVVITLTTDSGVAA